MAGLWRARLTTRNFEFEAFGEDIAAARQALQLGLDRHALLYRIGKDWWHDFADSIEVSFVRAGAAYCDRELIRERGCDD